MRRLISLIAAAVATCAMAGPARADWTAANPGVEQASRDPLIAGALAAAKAIDAAILAGDKDAFIGAFAPDAVVNNPQNSVSTRAMVERRFQAGAIAYTSLNRSIEYAARRGPNEVILMGEEQYEPVEGAPGAGKMLRRRFTDIWTRGREGWRLSVRQATIIPGG